jgi:amino acid transporter
MLLLRDNTARAKQIISIFWIMLGITIVNMCSLGWQYYLLMDAQASPESIDMETLRTSDTLRTFISSANLIMLVLGMIFFIMWFRRAYYNLHMLPWHTARHTEGWAAGSWFIPILSLFWPYQIMDDIWKGTQKAIRETLANRSQPPSLAGGGRYI